MKTYFDQVISNLLEDSYFNKFKYRKRDSSLIQKTAYGSNRIHLRHWSCFNISLDIEPQYLVRFDVLSKWFEKFSFKPLRSQRDGWYKGFSGDMLGKGRLVEFACYEEEKKCLNNIELLKNCIIECSEYVFDECSTLEKAYEKEIVPLLKGEKELRKVGADWFFENLTLCRIVDPKNYERLKEIHLKHAKGMFEREEPNMSFYYPRLDEILTYMENFDLKI